MQPALRLMFAVALSTALYAAALAFPPVATPLILLVPLPGLVLGTYAALTECGIWLFFTTLAVTILLGSDAVLGFVLPSGFPALVLAVAIRRAWTFELTVLAGVAVWIAGVAGLVALAYPDLPTLITTLRQQLASSIDVALSTYGSVGAPENALAAVQAERDLLVDGLMDVLPALVVLTGALSVIVNLVVLRSLAVGASAVNLRLWRAPDVLIWALIGAGFGMFLPLPVGALFARNLFIVVLGCYFCQGLAIVSYYLERFRLPRGIRVVGYVLIAVQHVITALVLALGVFDLWGNFRRLHVGPADLSLHPDGE